MSNDLFPHLSLRILDAQTIQVIGLYREQDDSTHYARCGHAVGTVTLTDPISSQMDEAMGRQGFLPSTLSQWHADADEEELDDLMRSEGKDPEAERKEWDELMSDLDLCDELRGMLEERADLYRGFTPPDLLRNISSTVHFARRMLSSRDVDNARRAAFNIAHAALRMIQRLDGEDAVLGLPAPQETPALAAS